MILFFLFFFLETKPQCRHAKDAIIDFLSIQKHKDIRVFTSAPTGGYGNNFPSIRVSENVKAIVGSQAMGAFIEEFFMHSSDSPIDKNDLKRITYCGETDGAVEFPSHPKINGTKIISRNWVWPYIHVYQSESYSNEHLLEKEKEKDVDEIMKAIGYEEFEIGETDKERIRLRVTKEAPKFDVYGAPIYSKSDDWDDYYDEEDFYESIDGHIPGGITSSSESEDEQPKVHQTITENKIKKLQKMVVPTHTWNHNIFNMWLFLFTKKLKKQFDIDFDPHEKAEKKFGPAAYTKFVRSYMRINKYLPVQTVHEEYDKLAPVIDKLLLENRANCIDIIDLIAYCFDDANRVVTPLFFPGMKLYK